MIQKNISQLNKIQIGLDIGKIDDPSALSVAEVVRAETGRFKPCERIPAHIDPKTGHFVKARDAEPICVTRYIIRSIGRLPLGMSYPRQAKKIVDMFCSDSLAYRKIRLIADVTGVGQAVFDIIRVELAERIDQTQGELKERLMGIELQPTSFVSGEKYNRKTGSLGKAFLVSRLQSRLQNGRIDAPKSKEMEQTLEELRVYQIKISEKGNDQYGAFKTGSHDDLATSLALSVLEDPYALEIRHSERMY